MVHRAAIICIHTIREGQNQYCVGTDTGSRSTAVSKDVVMAKKWCSQQSELWVPQNYKDIDQKQRKRQSRAIVGVDEKFVGNAGSICLQRLSQQHPSWHRHEECASCVPPGHLSATKHSFINKSTIKSSKKSPFLGKLYRPVHS